METCYESFTYFGNVVVAHVVDSKLLRFFDELDADSGVFTPLLVVAIGITPTIKDGVILNFNIGGNVNTGDSGLIEAFDAEELKGFGEVNLIVETILTLVVINVYCQFEGFVAFYNAEC